MKTLARHICVGILILGLVAILVAIIFGTINLWLEGMWYVVVAMIVFVLAIIGALNL